jgi:Ca2+-binding RTX toxin-like protein
MVALTTTGSTAALATTCSPAGREPTALYFETGLNASSNVDTITDFATGSDKIWLNHSIFNKLTVNGALDASMLRIGSAAADGNDHIIYNRDTGALIYDSNGNAAGGAVQFATIGKGLNLTAIDFNVFGAPATGR